MLLLYQPLAGVYPGEMKTSLQKSLRIHIHQFYLYQSKTENKKQKLGAWAYQTQLRIDLQGDPAE